MINLVIHYLEYGDKNAPLMVFLHGGGVSGDSLIITNVGHAYQ